jgi:hypothetical protein
MISWKSLEGSGYSPIHLPVGTQGCHQEPQPGNPGTQPKFEPSTSRKSVYEFCSYNNLLRMLNKTVKLINPLITSVAVQTYTIIIFIADNTKFCHWIRSPAGLIHSKLPKCSSQVDLLFSSVLLVPICSPVRVLLPRLLFIRNWTKTVASFTSPHLELNSNWSRAEQKLTAGNQPALSILAPGPAGTHGHIFVQRQDLCFVFSFVDPPYWQRRGWSFIYL